MYKQEGPTVDILEFAQIARRHPYTIRRKVLSGEIPHFRVFGKILIRTSDLEEFLLRQQEPAAPRGTRVPAGKRHTVSAPTP